MHSARYLRCIAAAAALLLSIVAAAQAGPPLICHSIEIGPAKTLPSVNWNNVSASGYDLQNLIHDTLAILDSNARVLVRMETLRRATIYARQDPQIAKELLAQLRERAAKSGAAGSADALSWFDAGYLVETYKQWIGRGESNPAAGLDGYAWVRKAISLRGPDAEMEFAAALITLSGPEREHRGHARLAMAGAKTDSLLARNLASQFHNQTVAELLASSSAGGVGK